MTSTALTGFPADPVAALVARAAITDTMLRYTRGGDAGRVEDFVSCFASDGALESSGAVHRGPGAIRAFMQSIAVRFSSDPAFLPARHHLASLWVEVDGPAEARAGAYFTLVAATGVDHWGVYRDRLVLVDGRWLFAHRRVKIEAARPGSPVADMVE